MLPFLPSNCAHQVGTRPARVRTNSRLEKQEPPQCSSRVKYMLEDAKKNKMKHTCPASLAPSMFCCRSIMSAASIWFFDARSRMYALMSLDDSKPFNRCVAATTPVPHATTQQQVHSPRHMYVLALQGPRLRMIMSEVGTETLVSLSAHTNFSICACSLSACTAPRAPDAAAYSTPALVLLQPLLRITVSSMNAPWDTDRCAQCLWVK